MAFTTANPIAVGDATEKQDLDVLRDNNDWLRDTMRVQHEVLGAGSRAGRHTALWRWQGSGSVAAGAGATTILSTSDAELVNATLYRLYVTTHDTTNNHSDGVVWHFRDFAGTALDQNVALASDYHSGDQTYWNHTSLLPASVYLRCQFNVVAGQLDVILHPGAKNFTYKYAIVRVAV